MTTVLTLVGSIRRDSINRALARALEKLSAGRLTFEIPDLGALPHYNDDLQADLPAAVTAFKARIEAADAVLWITPEFNRTVPPILTNAMAWGSRPYATNSWIGKVAAIAGATPGAIGTAVAQSHLRSLLPVQGMLVMGRPEVYLTMRPGLITETHDVTDDTTRAFLKGFIDDFATFVERHGARPRVAVPAE